MNKKTIVWLLRFLVFALFVFSAVAKMFPIWAFEKQLVDLGLMSWCNAPIFARALIGLEMAIGIAIMQPNYLKKLVLPATIMLLVVFCIHLTIEMVKHGAMSGNCGCFGQLIPMTPLEAVIKNLLTIGILIYLYRNVTDRDPGENNLSPLIIIWSLSTLAIFVLFPFCPCSKDEAALVPMVPDTAIIDEASQPADSVLTDTIAVSIKKDSATMVVKDSILSEPAPSTVKSRYAANNIFGGRRINIDKGKKIICFFVPGCDHCQHAAKELAELSVRSGFPSVYIYFMDEEAYKIPEFFQIAGKQFPYVILDIPKFWTLMGNGGTPKVLYLWNGNVMKEFEGTEDHAFKGSDLVKELAKPFENPVK